MNQYPSGGPGASGYMPPAPNFPPSFPGPQHPPQNGPMQSYPQQNPNQTGGGQVTQPCYNCGSMQHWAQHCPEPRRQIPAGAQKQQQQQQQHGGQGQPQSQQQQQGGNNQQQKKKRGPGPIITRYPVPPTAGQPGFGIPPRPPYVQPGFAPGFPQAAPAAPFNPQFQAPFQQPFQQPYGAPQQMPPQGFGMPPQPNFGYGQPPMAPNFVPPFNNPQQGRFNNNNNRRGGGANQRNGGGRYNPYPNPQQQMGPYNHPPPAVGGYQNMGGNRQMGGQFNNQGGMRHHNRNRRQGQNNNHNKGPGWKAPQNTNTNMPQKPLGTTPEETKAQEKGQEKVRENTTDPKDPALATKAEILEGRASVNGKGKRTHDESEESEDVGPKRVKVTDSEEKKSDEQEKNSTLDKGDDDLENFELEDSDGHSSTTVGKKPHADERSGTPNLDDEDLLADDLDDSSKKPASSEPGQHDTPTTTEKATEDDGHKSEKENLEKVDQLAD